MKKIPFLPSILILAYGCLGTFLFLACSPLLFTSENTTMAEEKKISNYDPKTQLFFNSEILDPPKHSLTGFERFKLIFGRIVLQPDPSLLPSSTIKRSPQWKIPGPSEITWIGHSTFLINIDNVFILTDPMFSERASPVSFFGPKRFAELGIQLPDLPPKIHTVLISHNHYDHLDSHSIRTLSPKVDRFLVPLGIKKLLIQWGIAEEKITEFFWNETILVEGITYTSQPVHHWSGRSLWDRNQTLWTAWSIKNKDHNIFFAGDMAYTKSLKTIGENHGPFHLTLIPIGAYSDNWNSHNTPEEALEIHKILKGTLIIPMHWGTFNLAIHPWDEPIKLFTSYAQEHNIFHAAPLMGQAIQIPKDFHGNQQRPQHPWWEEY